jgi:FkbM family methyltransferase
VSLAGRVRAGIGLARSLVVYWRPGRQAGLRRLYAPFVPAGSVVFDVGAHLGDRTAAFSALGARVVALEPHPGLLPWLRRLVGGRPGVTILGEALGAHPGTASLAVSPRHPTLSTLADGWRERLPEANAGFRGVRWEEAIEVPVRTLDALIAEYGTPAFCKIDVEGHEAEVLEGVSVPIPALSVEFVAGGLEVAERCVERLAGLGTYTFNAVRGERRTFHFPQWISADEALRWLRGGAEGIPSGDLYARLASPSEAPPAPALASPAPPLPSPTPKSAP